MKTCIKCQKEKDISEYYKSTKNKTGYENICKLCKNEYNNKNSKKLGQEYFNKSAKKWNDKNREKISKYNKHKYDTNKDYWLLNNDRKIYFKEWRHNNRDKLAKYGRNKYNNDINFKRVKKLVIERALRGYVMTLLSPFFAFCDLHRNWGR